MKISIIFLKTVLVAVALVLGFFPSSLTASEIVREKSSSWQGASGQLGDLGSLYEPRFTAGLKLENPIQVLAIGRRGSSSQSYRYESTSVDASYGKFDKNFIIDQKWANTTWVAKPTVDPARRLVGQVELSLLSGSEINAIIYANCDVDVYLSGIQSQKKCSKRDVFQHGGYLELRTPAVNPGSQVGRTDIVIRTKGLSYAQLIKIASNLGRVD